MEFRFKDGTKLFAEKRFSDFRTLYAKAKESNEELADSFTFPAKKKNVDADTKRERQNAFDDMMKQINAMAPMALNDWIADASADISSFEKRRTRDSTVDELRNQSSATENPWYDRNVSQSSKQNS